MPTKHPFARRIVIAFTLTVMVVSGFFSLSIFFIVNSIEERLASQDLHRELDILLQNTVDKGKPPTTSQGIRFFASNLLQYPIPESMKDLEKGFSEVTQGDRSYYVYMKQVDGERYVLAEDQSELEERERLILKLVVGSFVLSIVGAWLLGQLLARRVMTPLTQLAAQVRQSDQPLTLAQPLAPQYPDDEVGHLAAAFDSTLGQLQQSLERERLFTSDVSHELRTPLMIILGACELLNENPLQPQARGQVARIVRAAQEMHELVQTFLILARTRREESASGGCTSLAGVAEEQSQRWGPLIQTKGLAFELVEESSDSARYNLSFLRTVLSNLLRNALHYTESGTVRLEHFP